MMTMEHVSKVEIEFDQGPSNQPGPLHAAAVKAWLTTVPDGAILTQIVRDVGTQRDPDVRLIGLRASWSEEL